MRKLSLFIACSLDGFIARKNGGIDWLFHDADYGFKKFYASVDTVLCGRKTYELSKRLEKIPFAGKEVIVFSSKKIPFGKNTISSSRPAHFTRGLMRLRGKKIWLCGGSQIIAMLLNAGLVDEIIVSIHPILLGAGIPLFANQKKSRTLRLLKCRPFKSGLVQLSYGVIR